ncbi:MAG: serine hydrolase [Bryobacterales bacterium]|nr:serine hydrolase [Bryobacterales bacterium]
MQTIHRLHGILWMAAAALQAQPVAYVGKTAAYHQQQFNQLAQAGYRLTSISVHGNPGTELYSAVWRKKAGPAWFGVHGVSEATYKGLVQNGYQTGFWPVRVSAAGPAGSAKFAAIFEQIPISVAPTDLKPGSGDGSLAAWLKYFHDNEFKVISAAAYGTAAAPRFAVVAVANPKHAESWSTHSVSEGSYQKYFNAQTQQWARPIFIQPTSYSTMLAGFTDTQTGGWMAHHGLTAAGFDSLNSSYAAQGMIPLSVHGGGNPADPRYAAVWVASETPQTREWKVDGTAVVSLANLDSIMKQNMQDYGVRGAALAIVYQRRLVYWKAYTLAESGYPQVKRDTLFRVASLSKPITAVGTLRMTAAKNLPMTTTVQSILGIKGPQGQSPDPRWYQIDFGDLLRHEGGWDPAKSGDPMFRDGWVAGMTTGDLPVTIPQIHSAHSTVMLDNSPGTTYAYSNFGYSLLGGAIAKQMAVSYPQAIKNLVFTPMGITKSKIGESAMPLTMGEARYHDSDLEVTGSVFSNTQPLAPAAYGGWNQKNLDAPGGWVMPVADYARFLAGIHPSASNPILSSAQYNAMKMPGPLSAYTLGWIRPDPAQDVIYHNGGLSGTGTIAVKYDNHGLDLVLFLNKDIRSGLDTGTTWVKSMANFALNTLYYQQSVPDQFCAAGLPPAMTGSCQ